MRKMVVVAAVLLAAQVAQADFTSPINNGEISQANLLVGIYGGAFSTGDGGITYTNGTITATRIDDFATAGAPASKGTNVDLLLGAQAGDTDQLWDDGVTTIVAEARYAGYEQGFGYRRSDGTEIQLFQVTGTQFSVGGSGSADVTGQTGFEWVRTYGVASPQYSNVSRNADGLDHMITYQITGGRSASLWLLAWDDQFNGGDQDFNDMVVEIAAVPLPGAVLLGFLGLMAAGVKLRRFA